MQTIPKPKPVKPPVPLMPDQRDQFEERAAIREYDGKQPRAMAEREAMREVKD